MLMHISRYTLLYVESILNTDRKLCVYTCQLLWLSEQRHLHLRGAMSSCTSSWLLGHYTTVNVTRFIKNNQLKMILVIYISIIYAYIIFMIMQVQHWSTLNHGKNKQNHEMSHNHMLFVTDDRWVYLRSCRPWVNMVVVMETVYVGSMWAYERDHYICKSS